MINDFMPKMEVLMKLIHTKDTQLTICLIFHHIMPHLFIRGTSRIKIKQMKF
jgi:hypothetical protein